MPIRQSPPETALSERPPTAYLRDSERLCYALTNRRVGLSRTGDEAETISPGEDYGAVAELTDRRVVLAVGDPAAYDGDFLTAVPYTEMVSTTVTTEMLTARLRLETTGGTAWTFTAREADVEEVEQFLSAAADCWEALDSFLDRCAELSTALSDGDWARFDERKDGASAALDTAREIASDAPTDGFDDRLTRLEREYNALVRDRHALAGRELLARSQSLLDAGSYRRSLDRSQSAVAQFERALDVARNRGLDHGRAATGLEAARAQTETVVDRPVAAARERHRAATDRDALPDRIEGLEDALDAYRSVADLITSDDSPFSGSEDDVLASVKSVIDELLDAHLSHAEQRISAANWEWDTDNDEAAYELFVEGREHLDRAIELAETYPPGDPERIRDRRAELTDHISPLVVRYELEKAEATN